VVPRIGRVALFWSPSNPGSKAILTETQSAARSSGLQLQSLAIRNANELARAFEAALKEHAQAFLTSPDPVINNASGPVIDFATKNRLPAMYAAPEFIERGGLMNYAPDYG